MNANPLIVFCTTCKGRLSHLRETLRRNITDNQDYERSKFVVLDYGGDDGMEGFLRDECADLTAAGKLAVYRFDWVGSFRMAHAKNMAHRCGILEGADILVNLDADNFTGPGFASWVAAQFTAADARDVFVWAKPYEGLKDYGICGRIGVTRQAFLKTGGYDERFEAYAPDDMDFILRLQRIGYKAVEVERKFLNAISHGDDVRFREYDRPGPDQWHGAQFSEATVVNHGQIGMGLVTRNFGADRVEYGCLPKIELGRMPTRIFGIGLHKTATTSLNGALGMLGFDSAHWTTPDKARTIWNEMSLAGSSLEIDRYYALSDLPVSILYEKLDKAYPGSKFVLTVRDETEWIASIEKHWNRAHNHLREQWNVDQFSHQLHRLVYGQSTFDRDMFLARYRQHNEQVKRYFRSRPKTLLVMDVSRGAGWPELCRFLNVPAPAAPYPTLPSASA